MLLEVFCIQYKYFGHLDHLLLVYPMHLTFQKWLTQQTLHRKPLACFVQIIERQLC